MRPRRRSHGQAALGLIPAADDLAAAEGFPVCAILARFKGGRLDESPGARPQQHFLNRVGPGRLELERRACPVERGLERDHIDAFWCHEGRQADVLPQTKSSYNENGASCDGASLNPHQKTSEDTKKEPNPTAPPACGRGEAGLANGGTWRNRPPFGTAGFIASPGRPILHAPRPE